MAFLLQKLRAEKPSVSWGAEQTCLQQTHAKPIESARFRVPNHHCNTGPWKWWLTPRVVRKESISICTSPCFYAGSTFLNAISSEAGGSYCSLLYFVLRFKERKTNQLKGNSVVVKLDVILSLTLSMSTTGEKTTLFTHVATAKLFSTNTEYKKIRAPAEVRYRIPAK